MPTCHNQVVILLIAITEILGKRLLATRVLPDMQPLFLGAANNVNLAQLLSRVYYGILVLIYVLYSSPMSKARDSYLKCISMIQTWMKLS